MKYRTIKIYFTSSFFAFFSTVCTSLEIHITGKTKSVNFDSSQLSASFDALVFSILGVEFHQIDGNYRDTSLSTLLNAIDVGEEITFIINDNDTTSSVTFDSIFLSRFLRCVHHGLCAFISNQANPEKMLLPGTKQSLKDKGVKHFSIPTCTEFVHYWTFGITDFPFRNFRKYSLSDEDTPSMVVEIHNDSRLAHQCVYIGNGVCIGKIGSLGIYFHTIESIRLLYKSVFKVEFIPKKVWYRRNDDQDPPDSPALAPIPENHPDIFSTGTYNSTLQ